ncbi:competence damage-inducible protein A [Spirochaetia bacterium]|nr:competence damage-inducible protein A [Spirochaetia bacterium]
MTKEKEASAEIEEAAEKLVTCLTQKKQTVVLAESCTAGLVAAAIASVPGASAVLWGSFVTYALDAKEKLLAVPPQLLRRHGAVSRECALAMARGALTKSGADIACAVTGLAGPDGDGSETPVGTVWIAVQKQNDQARANVYHFEGGRAGIRDAAALQSLLEIIRNYNC